MNRLTVWYETQKHYAHRPEVESKLYFVDTVPPIATRPYKKTSVRFYNVDCIEIAHRLKEKTTDSIMILNMADWTRAGGCVDAGSLAQEEELFRRSDLFKFLHQKYFPMQKHQVVVSHGVEFYRNTAPTFALYRKPFKVDVISSPAPKYPALNKNGTRFETNDLADFMLQKIRGLLWAAYDSHAQYLILSAWGCGAFGCPPQHVGELFYQVIQEFDGCFKGICFAIIGSNYELFKSGYYLH